MLNESRDDVFLAGDVNPKYRNLMIIAVRAKK